MYKITNNLAPQYLRDLFEMRTDYQGQTNMTLRSSSNENYAVPKPRNNLFKNSLSYSGALIWNSIPLDVRTSKTLDAFTTNCLNWLQNKCLTTLV